MSSKSALRTLTVEQINTLQADEVGKYETHQEHPTFNSFILAYPRGAYTGMRTVGRKSVVELGSHMKRIVNSLSLMRFENSDGVEPETVSQMMSPFRNITSLEHRLVPLLRAGLENYYSNVDPTTATDHPSETKISLMVTYCYESRRPRFAAHFAPLVTPKKHRVKVEIENKARKMPEVKDSQWVRERAALEQHKLHDINEVVLTDDDGNLYEGMASNFFAVRKRETDGKSVVMCAALENILLGTVMKIVMAICEEDGIEFQWGFPRLQDARDNRWEGCFLTSTSRLLLPIEALYVPDGSDPIVFPETSETIEHIRHRVQEEIVNRAYAIS